jgi:O-antigen ligase
VILAASAFTLIFLAIALALAVTVGVALILVKDRALVLMVTTVATLIFPVHKLLGPLYGNTESGAPSFLVSSTMVALGLLYLSWFAEHRFRSDVLRALRRPVFWIPLVALFLTLPSIGNATNTYLSFAQLWYWGFVYLMFLGFAARIRDRHHVNVLLITFGLFAMLEAAVVVAQQVHLIPLGLLSSQADAESLERVTDTSTIGRPFGTLTHPVFLGITVAMIAVAMFALALYLTKPWVRLLCLLVVLACLGQIFLAEARSPMLGIFPVLGLMFLLGAFQKRIPARAWVFGALAVAVGLIVLSPIIEQFYNANFGSNHFSEEVLSRNQLSDVGWRMIDAAPVEGLGLNNYTQEMDKYIVEPLLFPGFPAHNVFILTTAETGLLGLAGLVAIGVSLAWEGVKLMYSRDPLFRAMGLTLVGILLLNLIAEQISYSTREEIPLETFWLLAALAIACVRIREDEASEAALARADELDEPPPDEPPPDEPSSEPVLVGA